MTPTFGYVLQTVPSGFSTEVMSNPARSTQALMEANKQAMQLAQPCLILSGSRTISNGTSAIRCRSGWGTLGD